MGRRFIACWGADAARPRPAVAFDGVTPTAPPVLAALTEAIAAGPTAPRKGGRPTAHTISSSGPTDSGDDWMNAWPSSPFLLLSLELSQPETRVPRLRLLRKAVAMAGCFVCSCWGWMGARRSEGKPFLNPHTCSPKVREEEKERCLGTRWGCELTPSPKRTKKKGCSWSAPAHEGWVDAG